MALKLITAPTVEPVSLTEAKLHLKQDSSADDTLITSLIVAARRAVEAWCLHSLISQTWDYFADRFPVGARLELPYPPLQSITGVYYTPNGEVETTWASANYIADTYAIPGGIVLAMNASWPGDVLLPVNGVRVRFVCGMGAASTAVDERAIAAIKLLVGHYYENREATTGGRNAMNELPLGVQFLLWDLRARALRF